MSEIDEREKKTKFWFGIFLVVLVLAGAFCSWILINSQKNDYGGASFLPFMITLFIAVGWGCGTGIIKEESVSEMRRVRVRVTSIFEESSRSKRLAVLVDKVFPAEKKNHLGYLVLIGEVVVVLEEAGEFEQADYWRRIALSDLILIPFKNCQVV